MLRGTGLTANNINSMAKPIVSVSSPTTGSTIVAQNNSTDQVVFCTLGAGIANLTVTFPADATSVVGQIFRVGSDKAIVTLVLNGATTILNSAVTLAAGEIASYLKVAANTWVRT